MKKKLTIGVDIRDLQIAKTGTKTYLEELCRAFNVVEDQDVEFHFIDTNTPVYTGRNRFLKSMEHVKFMLWKQIQLPLKARQKKCDILFCSDFFVPYLRLGYQTVPVFHDAFFWEYPAHYNKFWLKLFYTLGVSAAKRSACIIAPTEYAKKRILHFLNVPSEQIKVVHEAPKSLVPYRKDCQPESSKNIPTQKFFLHIGTFEKRKNLVRLVEAFCLLHAKGYTDYSLVLIGQSSPKEFMDDSLQIQEIIKRNQVESFVISPGYVPDNDLAWYYHHAECYVFPSINEGFGLPVLEAFSYDLPVLIANNTCLPEVGAAGVLSFDPYDVQEISEKMETVITSKEVSEQLKQKGSETLLNFSWQKTAHQLLALFKSIKSTGKLV